MTEEQKEYVEEFVKSEYPKIVSLFLEMQITGMADQLKTFALTQETEKDFLVKKYELEGARKLASNFKAQIARLKASDFAAGT